MSFASSERSRRAAALLSAAPGSPYESRADLEWDGRVAREVRHQEIIEATYDRAEAYAGWAISSARSNGSIGPPRPVATFRRRIARSAHAGFARRRRS